jgi:hypothetical protein
MNKFRRLVRVYLDWSKWIAAWLFWDSASRRVWAAMIGVPFAMLVGWRCSGGWEGRVRITGLVLQLMGALIAVVGVNSRRKLFDRSSLLQLLTAWCGRFPHRNVTVSVVGAGAMAMAGAAVTAIGTVSAEKTASVLHRIDLLEQGQQQLFGLSNDLRRIIEQERAVRSAELQAERIQREKKDEENRKTLQEAAAGGLHLEVIAIVWVFLGVLLATASPEIAKFLGP